MKLFLVPLMLAATLSVPAQVRVGGSEAQVATCYILPDFAGSTTATLLIDAGPIVEAYVLIRPNGWGNLPLETIAIAYSVGRGGVAGGDPENPSQAYFRAKYTDATGLDHEIYTPVEGGNHAKAWKEHVEKIRKSVVDFPPAAKKSS